MRLWNILMAMFEFVLVYLLIVAMVLIGIWVPYLVYIGDIPWYCLFLIFFEPLIFTGIIRIGEWSIYRRR